MKTLKFRIYDKTEKRMKFLDGVWNMPDPSYDFDDIQQFTGLLDRFGVSIYEGDIVKYKTFYYGKEKEHIVEVKWEKEATDLFGEPDFIGFLARWEGGEVIGNIYEHSHLLDK